VVNGCFRIKDAGKRAWLQRNDEGSDYAAKIVLTPALTWFICRSMPILRLDFQLNRSNCRNLQLLIGACRHIRIDIRHTVDCRHIRIHIRQTVGSWHIGAYADRAAGIAHG
jgi:hypothetical protein